MLTIFVSQLIIIKKTRNGDSRRRKDECIQIRK